MENKIEENLSKFHRRPLSWSSISSFTFSPESKEKWYSNYILDRREPPSPELIFGSKIGKLLETDPTYLPEIPRHNKMENQWDCVYKGIKITGRCDSFCITTKSKLLEYKTGKRGTYEWSQKKVNEFGQISFYCALNFITYKVKPEDMEIQLIWMPTKKETSGSFLDTISFDGDIQFFKTKRTMTQIIKFLNYVEDVYKDMESFIEEKSIDEARLASLNQRAEEDFVRGA